jgi:two-component system OmpR family response regulator
MLEIALTSHSENLAQKISQALPSMSSCMTLYESLSQLSSVKGHKRFDLIVLHHPHACIDKEMNFSIGMHLPRSTPALAIVSDKYPECSVQLLNAGIDRCLPESFDVNHFSAVARALTRRLQGRASSVTQYGALSFNHETKRASIFDNEVDLTKREAQVLEVLLMRVGQIISKENFIEEMDPSNIDLNASAVEVYIHRLRKKIKAEHLPVRNIKRCGYFLRRFDPPGDAQFI